MNTKRTTMFFRVVHIFAFVLGMVLVPTQGAKADITPRIRANLHPYGYDRVYAMGWPVGIALRLEIDDPTTLLSPDYTETRISTSTVEFNPWETYDMKIGDIITVSGGGITRFHTVLDVVITSIDVEADIVSGTAGPGINQVYVSTSNPKIDRWVDVAGGQWSADFSIPGDQPEEMNTCDFMVGDLSSCDMGNAFLYESDGDFTTAHWDLALPYIQVESGQGWIDTFNWLNGLNLPSGIPLTLTVDNDTDPNNGYIYQATQLTGPPHQPYLGVGGTTFHVEQDDPTVDLLPGQYVTAAYGSMIKTTRIQSVTFDFINETDDTAGGTGPAGSSASVWINTSAGELGLDIVIGSDGHWLADFGAEGQDIQSPQNASIIVYEDGLPDEDATIATWVNQNAPDPIIETLGTNQLAGSGWPLGMAVTMTIDDPTNGIGVDYTATQMPFEEPWAPAGSLRIPLPQEHFLKPGDIIQATNGVTTKTMEYAYIEIAEVDTVSNVIHGFAYAGTVLKVEIHDSGGVFLDITADTNGNWTADFQGMFDLTPNTRGKVRTSDSDGDSTIHFFESPYLNVYLIDDLIQGLGWKLDSNVTLTIDDPGNGPGVDLSETKVVEVAWWNPSETEVGFATFDLGIRPGQLMVMTDGTTTVTHVVSHLTVTEINSTEDTVAGVSDPGGIVEVGRMCDDLGCAIRRVTANGDGDWLADFSVPGEDSDEQDLFDIRPGTNFGIHQKDDDGNSDGIYLEVPLNEPPSITLLTAPVAPIQLGQSIDVFIDFTDPDGSDSHTVVWDWGDGLTTTLPAVPPTVSTSHTYTTPGVYTITATITDAAGESDTEAFQYVVIYDPNGGFVTGGGWIWSPEGAYTADPSMTGKATFGFVSKYQKGANIPSGNTEFQFKVADLNFKSTSYEWLVIAGSKAQYKGTGTINGTGEYKFMLTAVDGSPDKFRIKIWEDATEELIYDNQLGAADADDPSTEIQGGSIVIHKEK